MRLRNASEDGECNELHDLFWAFPVGRDKVRLGVGCVNVFRVRVTP